MNTTMFSIVMIASNALTGIISFFLTRKKYNTDIETAKIKNLSEAFDTYKEIMQENMKEQRKSNMNIERLKKAVVTMAKDICIKRVCDSREPYTLDTILTILNGDDDNNENMVVNNI